MKLLPDLRMKSRMKYLDEREQKIMVKEKNIFKDEKEIFEVNELTIKEYKMRNLKEKILLYAEKNTEGVRK